MFGFSLAELIVVFLVIIIFIKPQDLPEIAHFLGRVYYKIRRFFHELKIQMQTAEKELGLDNMRSELNRGIAEEKIKVENAAKEIVKIVDIYGNEHEVDAKSLRSDLTDEELKEEIERHNSANKQRANPQT